WAGGFLGASSALLAFASILTWHWCGEAALSYLGAGRRGLLLYRAAFFLAAVLGSVIPVQTVLSASDLLNFFMAAPNLLALFRARKTVREETLVYISQKI